MSRARTIALLAALTACQGSDITAYPSADSGRTQPVSGGDDAGADLDAGADDAGAVPADPDIDPPIHLSGGPGGPPGRTSPEQIVEHCWGFVCCPDCYARCGAGKLHLISADGQCTVCEPDTGQCDGSDAGT